MRTIEVKLYKLSELSEEAKEKAIESLVDINVDYEWWEFVFDGAKNIGLRITGFDLYPDDITGDITEELSEVCKLILEEHGETTPTYQLAKRYQHKHGEDNELEFTRELLQEYLSMLKQEHEYLTSEEAIIETIEANECEFTEDGKIA